MIWNQWVSRDGGRKQNRAVWAAGAHPEFFLEGGWGGGRADPEAIYNLCLILKITL
jgi:hypothetical protein